MKKIIFLLLFSAVLGTGLFAQTLKAYVMNSEPLGYVENGTPRGEHVDYLKAIADKAGVSLDIQVVPKNKLFAAMKSGDADCAIFFRSKKWDDTVEYAEKIRDIRILAVNRNGVPLKTFADLHNSDRVGVLANTAISADFDGDAAIKKYSVPDYETMIKLLDSKRIDTGVGNAIVLSYLINKMGKTGTIQSEGITLGKKAQWLQFSKKSANLAVIEKMKAAVNALQADGTLDEILTSYAGKNWKSMNNLD